MEKMFVTPTSSYQVMLLLCWHLLVASTHIQQRERTDLGMGPL